MSDRPTKILVLTTAFTELYISGFVNRFVGLWNYLHKTTPDQVHLLTNKSLWNHFFKRTPTQNETVVAAGLKWFRYTSRLFYPFYILYVYKKEKCTSIHIAASIFDWLILVRVFNFFRIPYCLTFASNSIEMAGYGSVRQISKLKKVMNEAKYVDILNPTHYLHDYKCNKFISPCSFPYITEASTIPPEKFLNEHRENLIVFCGSIIEQKNPVLAAKGFSLFLAENPESDAALVFFGQGDQQHLVDEIAHLTNAKFNRKAIYFLPYSELENTLSRSKIFLSLQDYDNYPSQSLMEGMLFCNSIISIDIGDTQKMVKPSMNNVLLKEKSVEGLSGAIQTILADYTVNFANRNFILEQFTVQKFADYFFTIHQKIRN